MTNQTIKVIVFDLGGVLVDWVGTQALVELSDNSLTEEQARRYWLESLWVRKFEIGRCSPNQFASGVISELHLAVSPEKFLTEFTSWDRGLLPGAIELLNNLRPYFLLACLSNNNELHWKKLNEQNELGKKFHRLYISHLTGLIKPTEEAFKNLLHDLNHPPDTMLYFDDNQECIWQALKFGMRAYQVAGAAAVREVLKNLNINA
jgi:putative hydrolase of the HAD superfamily